MAGLLYNNQDGFEDSDTRHAASSEQLQYRSNIASSCSDAKNSFKHATAGEHGFVETTRVL